MLTKLTFHLCIILVAQVSVTRERGDVSSSFDQADDFGDGQYADES